MSPKNLTALQRRLFEIMRAFDDDPGFDLAAMAEDLPEPQRVAVAGRDVATLGAWGVHPCMLIGFAYAVGVQRPEFMDRLPQFKLSGEVPRWRR